MRALAWTLALALAVPAAGAQPGEAAGRVSSLAYELPAAGSYELPVIDRVSDHQLLDSSGRAAPLLGLAPGSCAIVSFVYRSCTDASGCPLALASLQRVDRSVAQRAELRERVRLVTVSFDPERDRPEAMAELRRHMAPRSDWRFLTAGDAAALQPLLDDYGQDAVPLLTADGERSGIVRHVVKVFLVDADGGIRNVYSTGFLDYRLLLRDVETLLLTSSRGDANR